MPFIPHTQSDIQEMLAQIGVSDIEALFDEIPQNLRVGDLNNIPPGLLEMQVTRLMHTRAAQDTPGICFIGAGAYDHHVPAAVWQIATRGEFYSAYTPYQAEASQGTLQVIFEYQSMMTALLAMDVSNASLYDGASALAEAVLMAVRAHRRKEARVLVPTSVHPYYRQVVQTIVTPQGIEVVEIEVDRETGRLLPGELSEYDREDIAALVIPQPNFFGVLEDVDALTDWVHERRGLAIALVNPLACSVLKPPGEWGTGKAGADIACGDGQPLGVPMAGGGPYYGFLCCTQSLVRQMPGRIVGRTVDRDGRTGYTLTLQPREQHIRRSKATSNICTNQGLIVTASTIHMALMGADGLAGVASACHANSRDLRTRLTALSGVESVFDTPFFHEFVLRLDRPVEPVIRAMADQGILAGFALGGDYPWLTNALLVCATEQRTAGDMERYTDALQQVLAAG